MTLAHSFNDLTAVNSFAALPPEFYTRLPTTPLNNPRLVHASAAAGALIGLAPQAFLTKEFLAVVSGSMSMPGGDTLASVYSGHQFGVWAGQLGDGRAHLLGELSTASGGLELQLKGAGMTPYSRMGDGRAVLRSSVREYLASHAMRGLGIPTTQALSLVAADNPVRRETVEKAAVVARLAPSFIRFGSFEHWAARKRPDLLKVLADYVIDRFYPECRAESDPYVALLAGVVERTALLMADWQVVGFCHGVMNTDNMSILGLTLDYGPYGFMDGFDAKHICNHTDAQGRYAWHAQPAVAHWNLYQLANSLYEIAPEPEALKAALDQFEPVFLKAMQSKMTRKLGLGDWHSGDEILVDELWTLMQGSHADFSLTFRQLAYAPGLTEACEREIERDLGVTVGPHIRPFLDLFVDREAAQAWLAKYSLRLTASQGTPWQARAASMLAVNPLYVLRNYLAQKAITAAEQGDFSEVARQVDVLQNPYLAREGLEAYALPPPAGAPHLEVSCSS